MNVDPKKDHVKNHTFAEIWSLRKIQHPSKPFKPFQTKPSESKVNTISNVAAASSSAPIIQSVHDAEDSKATPSPSPHPSKVVSLVGRGEGLCYHGVALATPNQKKKNYLVGINVYLTTPNYIYLAILNKFIGLIWSTNILVYY
jgi:hypothetical protein